MMDGLNNVLRQSLAIAWKDVRLILQDRGSLIVLFVLPLLMGSMFGSMATQGSEEGGIELPVYLVNQDTGAHGKQIADILHTVTVLDIQELDTVDQADALVGDGDRLAAIIIPAGLSDSVDTYQPAAVRVLVDPAQEAYGSLITGIMKEVVAPVITVGEVQYGIRTIFTQSGLFDAADPQARRAAEAQSLGAMMTQLQKMQADPRIVLVNEDAQGAVATGLENAFSLTLPNFTVWFAFFIVGAVSSTLLREREEGTLNRLLGAPIPRGAIILGKVLAYLTIPILQVLIIFAIGNVVFDMSLGRSLIGLLLVTVALGLAATSLGMMIAGLARSSRQADLIGLVLGFVLAGLGGCVVISSHPQYRRADLLGQISRLTPHAHGLEAYRRLLVEGGGVVDVLPQVGVLLLMSAVFLLVARWRFRFER